jgi:tetratricopeptide (TPR) repeat protein
VYGKSTTAITNDLRSWAQKPKRAITLPAIAAVDQGIAAARLRSFEWQLLIGNMLLASGSWERAKGVYLALEKESPANSDVAVALGAIALQQHNVTEARAYWKRALEVGIRDSTLCYRYAILADDAEVPKEEVMRALKRAIELKPDFDDARYKLGLLENNTGQYESALEQFRAIEAVPAARAYAYWTAMAVALTETDHRDEANHAAEQAFHFARTEEERTSARQLAYTAQTDLTVQFARDAQGNLRIVTARKPHGATDWNPFVEPGDQIRSATGNIREVECRGGTVSGFAIDTSTGAVRVDLPDPQHVLITGGKPEFVCGAEDGRRVAFDYAAVHNQGGSDGVLRGMRFQ